MLIRCFQDMLGLCRTSEKEACGSPGWIRTARKGRHPGNLCVTVDIPLRQNGCVMIHGVKLIRVADAASPLRLPELGPPRSPFSPHYWPRRDSLRQASSAPLTHSFEARFRSIMYREPRSSIFGL